MTHPCSPIACSEDTFRRIVIVLYTLNSTTVPADHRGYLRHDVRPEFQRSWLNAILHASMFNSRCFTYYKEKPGKLTFQAPQPRTAISPQAQHLC